ncbi:hypothetical protein A4H02_08115 [Fervidobacterium thailandense]|uniref:Uncharacterized protein n=1 Tax=Fervidobacterium thailandense TaxID=1008305 RepID=A0A1E3G1E0_9BACT|nr:hypothetical protein A4H02_08115 [Fervidobacterium thailandense]
MKTEYKVSELREQWEQCFGELRKTAFLSAKGDFEDRAAYPLMSYLNHALIISLNKLFVS